MVSFSLADMKKLVERFVHNLQCFSFLWLSVSPASPLASRTNMTDHVDPYVTPMNGKQKMEITD